MWASVVQQPNNAYGTGTNSTGGKKRRNLRKIRREDKYRKNQGFFRKKRGVGGRTIAEVGPGPGGVMRDSSHHHLEWWGAWGQVKRKWGEKVVGAERGRKKLC